MTEDFGKSTDSLGQRVSMNGCPCQNSKKTLNVLENVGALLFKIPLRSSGFNPIEKFFVLVANRLLRLEKGYVEQC